MWFFLTLSCRQTHFSQPMPQPWPLVKVKDKKSVLVQVMAWRLTGDKPLPEAILTQFTDAYTIVFASKLKHRHALNNSTQAAKHISISHKILFSWKLSWIWDSSYNGTIFLTLNFVCHYTHYITEPKSKSEWHTLWDGDHLSTNDLEEGRDMCLALAIIYRIMYVLAWRTVYALTIVLFWCLFPVLRSNEGNKHQNNTWVSA